MPKWIIGKRVVATVSMIFMLLISLQSCVVGIGNAFSSSGEVSGAAGLFVAMGFLISGIIVLFSAKSRSRVPLIISAAILWFGYFIAKMLSGSYTDLVIWGFVSYAFGVFYLLCTAEKKKEYIIISAVSLVYLLIALI